MLLIDWKLLTIRQIVLTVNAKQFLFCSFYPVTHCMYNSTTICFSSLLNLKAFNHYQFNSKNVKFNPFTDNITSQQTKNKPINYVTEAGNLSPTYVHQELEESAAVWPFWLVARFCRFLFWHTAVYILRFLILAELRFLACSRAHEYTLQYCAKCDCGWGSDLTVRIMAMSLGCSFLAHPANRPWQPDWSSKMHVHQSTCSLDIQQNSRL